MNAKRLLLLLLLQTESGLIHMKQNQQTQNVQRNTVSYYPIIQYDRKISKN